MRKKCLAFEEDTARSAEKQEELGLNFYDYGARNYDAAIGRWMNVDPLAEKYVSFTPYAYVGNRPLIAVDPDGRDIVFIINKTRYRFDGTNLVNGKGSMINPKSYQGNTVGRIVNAYKTLAKSDKHYKNQIQTLIDSKNDHLINTDMKSYSGGSVKGGNEFDSNKTTDEKIKKGISIGSSTRYNFDKHLKKSFEEAHGVPKTDETTVAHELQHQYDFEIGNMKDSHGKENNNDNPSEMRGVKNEEIIRKKLNIGIRKDYDGKRDK